jgi:formiminoglutamase
MEKIKNKIAEINADYLPGQAAHWTGRSSNPAIGKQYWHQAIELLDIRGINEPVNPTIALVGYSCDEGVRRNQGRIGSKQGPQALREKLAKMPLHFDSKIVGDFGDVTCIEQDMESCQKAFSRIISHLISRQIFTIGIGGGHDMAYAHFMGIHEVIKHTAKNKIGIINFDAHFDLRPMVEQPNSGTPFNQIITQLKQSNETVEYFAIGIQQQSNTKELFEIAKQEHVVFVDNFECESTVLEIQNIQKKLAPFIEANDYLYITIDLDGFSSAYAPGVSAPSPLGFSPNFMFKMLQFLFDTKKVISCDIAELNPALDHDNLTANLAARIVDFIVCVK